MSRSLSAFVSSSFRDLQAKVSACSVTCEKSRYFRPRVRSHVYSNCCLRQRALISSPRPGKMRSVKAATGRRSKTANPSSAMALMLLSDDAAITDSAESAVTAPANRLTKFLLFKCPSYSRDRDVGRMIPWDGELAKLRMINAVVFSYWLGCPQSGNCTIELKSASA